MSELVLHLTETRNISSIMDVGLQPQCGPRASAAGEAPGTWFFPTLKDLEGAHWLLDSFGDHLKLAVLVVDITGLATESDVAYEVATRELVSPDRIRILTEDMDDGDWDYDVVNNSGELVSDR